MRVWRICRRERAGDPLGGRGGLHASGRWHERGARIVYTSATLSLAALEMLVHADRDLLPADLVQIEIEVPVDLQIERIEIRDLPSTWRHYPGPQALRRLGMGWIDRRRTAVLRVPSAVIPAEHNYLLNPLHDAMRRIRVAGRRRFVLDLRLAP